MEELIRLSQEDREIRRIVETVAETESAQGLVLDFDPFWLTGWNYISRFGNSEFERAVLSFFRTPYWGDAIRFEEFLEELPENQFPPSPPDLHWSFPQWQWRNKELGFDPPQSPVRVTVCLRPGSLQVPRIESRQYRIRYQTRPVATLSTNPKRFRRPVVGGLSTGVGSTLAGTLGGVVRDQHAPHRKYGVTCAHVMTSGRADQPAQADSWRARAIGTVVRHTPLQPSTGHCTPYATSGVNSVDAALIEIDASTAADMEVLDIGPLTGISPRSNVLQGQRIEFTGRTSGHRTLRVGGLGVFYQLRMGAQTYCFKNLIQLSWPRLYQVCGGRPVNAGDSGAWICNYDSAGVGWCGMIIGDDRLHGYAVYAETIEEWWRLQGLNLTVT